MPQRKWCTYLSARDDRPLKLQCRDCGNVLLGFNSVPTAVRSHKPNGTKGPCRTAEATSDPSGGGGGGNSSGGGLGEQSPSPPRQLANGGGQPTFTGRSIARLFGRELHYGRVTGQSAEIVVERGVHTTQYVVVYEDGMRADLRREELLEAIRLYQENPPLMEDGAERQVVVPEGVDHEDGSIDHLPETASMEFSEEEEDGMVVEHLPRLEMAVGSGCRGNLLTFCLNLLGVKRKGRRNISNNAVSEMLTVFHNTLGDGNIAPKTYAEVLRLLQVPKPSTIQRHMCPKGCKAWGGNLPPQRLWGSLSDDACDICGTGQRFDSRLRPTKAFYLFSAKQGVRDWFADPEFWKAVKSFKDKSINHYRNSEDFARIDGGDPTEAGLWKQGDLSDDNTFLVELTADGTHLTGSATQGHTGEK